MKVKAKFIILVTVLVLWSFSAFAIRHTVGLRGGLTLPFADIDEETTNHLMGGLNYEAWLKDYLSLGIYPYYTQLEGEESGVGYESTLMGGDVMLKYRPTSPKLSLNFPTSPLHRISPFGQLGFGVVNHDSEIQNSTVQDDGISLSAPSAALGVSLQTIWNLNLDLGAQYVFANSDKLDLTDKNVSESYLMPFLGLGFSFGGQETRDAMSKYAPKVVRTLLKNRISMEQDFTLSGVQFEIGSANLTPEAQKTLDEVAKAMQEAPQVKVEIQGHTDNTGTLDLNNRLSLQRAESVKKYLVGKGVDDKRMTTKGFGPSKPIATNDTPEGRTENRRIEFVIVK